MRWPAMVEHHIIGDVDESRDRPLARRSQPTLHPARGSAILHAADRLTEESGAAVGVLDADRHRAGETALDQGHGEGFESTDARRREVPRNSAHTHAILPVRR